MLMNKKLIIFDLDGTLIDTDKLIFMAYRHLFKKFGNGYEPTFSEYINFLGPTLMEMFPKYFKEDMDVLLSEYRKYSAINSKYYLSTINGANEVVNELKNRGYILAIVSSKIKNTILQNLKDLQLESYFDYVVGADEVNGKYKPDPYSINIVLNHYGISSEDAVMIGDSMGDLLCGKNANVTRIAVNYSLKGKFYEDKDTDYSIDSLYDLLDLFPGRR